MKKRIKTLLGQSAFASGLHWRTLTGRATIVLFHRVDDQLAGDPISRTVAEFRSFCAFFKRHFDVVSLSELVDRRTQGRDISRTLVITFDDGYLDNFTNAAPILREMGLPASFFIATGFIGTDHVPFWDEKLRCRPQWMTWDHVRTLADMGFEIGAHTDTHVDLGKVDTATAKAEIECSKHKIESRLGRRIRHFAYPFGGREHITDSTRALVPAAGFACCLSGYGGSVGVGDDIYNLQRIPISPWYDTPEQFGLELLLQARAAAASRRDASRLARRSVAEAVITPSAIRVRPADGQ